jgi:HK97 family phage portal protein
MASFTDYIFDFLITQSRSRGVKEDYSTSFQENLENGVLRKKPFFGETPDFKVEDVKDIYKKEPMVRAATQKVVNKAMGSGYRLEPKNQKSGLVALKEKMDSLSPSGLDFDKHLEEVIGNLVLYNNAFVEIIEEEGEMYVNLLEPEYMEVKTDVHGDVKYYYQAVDAADLSDDMDGRPTWSPEEVIHIKLDHFTTNAWSPVDLEAIKQTVEIKQYIRNWLKWFFQTHQMRSAISLSSETNEKQVKKLLSQLEAMADNPRSPLLTSGEMQIQRLQEFGEDADNVLQLLNWCDDQILSLMHVPPTLVGKNNDSGKESAAEMRKQFEDYVQSIQRTVSRYEEREVFPKLGAPAVALKWGTVSASKDKEIFETARAMRQGQFTQEAIQEYLAMRGIHFETEQVLKSDEEIAAMSNKELGTGNESIKGNESADTALSRERQDEDDVQRGTQE